MVGGGGVVAGEDEADDDDGEDEVTTAVAAAADDLQIPLHRLAPRIRGPGTGTDVAACAATTPDLCLYGCCCRSGPDCC